MAEWKPNPDGLQQLVHLLSQSQIASQEVQKQIYQQLQEFHKISDYNNYLIYIFSKLDNTPQNTDIRVSSGLLLKNNISQYYEQLDPSVKKFIQQEILACLGDGNDSVRLTAGGIVASIVRHGGLDNWPGLMENLTTALRNPNTPPTFLEGILLALRMVCEDSATAMCVTEKQGGPEKYEQVLNVLIPTLLKYLEHNVPLFRRYALECLNQFIVLMPRALYNSFQIFLRAVFELTKDGNPKLRKVVCTSFVFLASVRIDFILPNFDDIVPMMLAFTKDEDSEIALEACEFWNAVCDYGIAKDALRPHLQNLVPVLLDCMVYSEEDQYLLEEENQDSSVPDSEQDIEPIHYKSRSGGDEEDDDDDDESDFSEWNLRKCSAAALDELSGLYRSELLSVLIPLIQHKIQTSSHWAVIESIILALGAIAKGCYKGMFQYLPDLIPYFFQQLQNPEVLVKTITCWSVSRYAYWITQQERSKYLQPLLAQLFKLMLDKNKKIQQASCTAITHIQESTRVNLLQYFEPIVNTFHAAFSVYQSRNRLILYDAIGIFSVASIRNANEEQKQKFVNQLVPSLIQHWNEYRDDDKALCNMAECFIDIYGAAGVYLQQFTSIVFNRCLQVIDTNLVFFAANRETRLDSDFIVASLNLLSVITETFTNSIETLVANSNLVGLIYRCMKENSRIRQETFALLGDISPYCMAHIYNVMNAFIPEILASIAPHPGRSSGNACWALGMLMRYSTDQAIEPFAQQICDVLEYVLGYDKISKELMENAAIALGWLANRCPPVVAKSLENVFARWCFSLIDIVEADDKKFAFFGLCKVVQMNPGAIFNQNLVHFFNVICAWDDPCPELGKQFLHLLQQFKNSAPQNEWIQLMSKVDPMVAEKLAAVYNI